MCRRIAPAAGRQRGIVKWYSRGKGYGFITTVQGADVFLHKSALAEGQSPCAGQLVEFALSEGAARRTGGAAWKSCRRPKRQR